jgi:hypothetical protein
MKTTMNIIYLALALFAFACFTLSPTARAVDPPPDGGYPNQNTAEGDNALFNLDTGTDNTALGFEALFQTTAGSFNTAVGSKALTNNIGRNNTAVGFGALLNNFRGNHNTALGAEALSGNTSGDKNTAVGYQALNNNLADWNTAVGFQALKNNADGTANTAIGYGALLNTTACCNTAIGAAALVENTTGGDNTAIGASALSFNTTGNFNNAFGHYALSLNTTGYENTAIGVYALESNFTGYRNTAIGHAALADGNGNDNTANGVNALVSNAGNNNVAIGVAALEKNTTGSHNIGLGSSAGRRLTIGDNNIDIGNQGLPRESNVIRIGTVGTQTNTFIAGINGVTVAGGVAVVIDANGQLGTTTSSASFKEAVKPMDKASEAILSLKPVTFRYKHDLDPEGIPQFGLVAEEVEKVNPDLVARDEQGNPYTVRYDAVNAMLLNEFLKEHRIVQEQKATIAEFKHNFAEQQKQIEALTVGLQEVKAQVETSRLTPQTVVSRR